MLFGWEPDRFLAGDRLKDMAHTKLLSDALALDNKRRSSLAQEIGFHTARNLAELLGEALKRR